jgi:hypothetical protein
MLQVRPDSESGLQPILNCALQCDPANADPSRRFRFVQ